MVSARRRRRPGNSIRASTHASGRPNARQTAVAVSDASSDRRSALRTSGVAEVGDERTPRRPPQQPRQRQDEEQCRHRPRRQRQDRRRSRRRVISTTATESSPHATTCHPVNTVRTSRFRADASEGTPSAEGWDTRRNRACRGETRMMRKWILAVAALVAVVGPGTGAVWMNSQSSQAADTIVKVDSEKFDPAEITVAPGASITWQNADQSGVHTAKADDGSFDTGTSTRVVRRSRSPCPRPGRSRIPANCIPTRREPSRCSSGPRLGPAP